MIYDKYMHFNPNKIAEILFRAYSPRYLYYRISEMRFFIYKKGPRIGTISQKIFFVKNVLTDTQLRNFSNIFLLMEYYE